MKKIYIPQLARAPQQTETLTFDQAIPGLETLTPVRGHLQVRHCKSYLEVSAIAETILTLTCHRCLQQYNYRLAIQPTELIWLEEHKDADIFPFDQDISSGDELVETLPPDGHFDPTTWLYEQLCLEIPQRQLCEQNCPGIQVTQTSQSSIEVDQRWASLEVLRQQLNDKN